MKEIWTKEQAEYHGEFVNFGPMIARPKPAKNRTRRSIEITQFALYLPSKRRNGGLGSSSATH
jgi:hypothetical protein